ncbi:MAG: 4-alpha-glucanotransferase [Ilumatobacteraceae bacterium]
MHDEWGIRDGYYDIEGSWHPTPDETRDRLRRSMGTPATGVPLWFVAEGQGHVLWNPCRIVLEDGTELGPLHELPPDLPIGYHDLAPADGSESTRLIVHPSCCPPLPRASGASAQLYALWSDRSWGIGDLGDLRTLAISLRRGGGSAILVSPLHQPAPATPQEDSPYYPSTRRAWNPLLLAIDAPPPADLVCHPDDLIDRDAVWSAKRAALERRFDSEVRSAPALQPPTRKSTPTTPPTPTTARTAPPSSVAAWNALCDEHGSDWTRWPDDVRRYDPVVIATRCAEDEAFAHRAEFHDWCQGLMGDQLQDVTASDVRIIGDLAIGFSPSGADAWEFQDLLALDMRLGAPPDPFNQEGQEWGIPPFVPWRLRAAAYRPFIDTIRCALRGVHGLRMDHVMGLFRQFWIPAGSKPEEGAYVTFPADELLAIVCLEATRAAAFVIGEDLGTVEEGVREQLAACNVAGTKVLLFEEQPPNEWTANCLATVTTHDLPTVAGLLTGTDGTRDLIERVRAVTDAPSVDGAIAAVHRALLASPAALRLVSVDDVAMALERPNHPGTIDRPNWRRRLPVSVDQIM